MSKYPRNPRPKGAQRGVVRRDVAGASQGCLMALLLLPFTAARALLRR
jgi:hypothetical protein